jgi:hypothetical protein
MIQSEPGSIEQIWERIHRMSDSELLRYGQAARYMAEPKNNHRKPNPSFQVQLDEARGQMPFGVDIVTPDWWKGRIDE